MPRSLGHPVFQPRSELAPESRKSSITEELLLKSLHHTSKEGFGIDCFNVSPALKCNDIATQAPACYRVPATSGTVQGRCWVVVGADVILPWE